MSQQAVEAAGASTLGTDLLAFLYSRDAAGQWGVSAFSHLEPLLAAVHALQVERKSALLHVGFWRPTVVEVEAMASRCPGLLILSDSAAGALCEHFSVGGLSVGSIQGVGFRLAAVEHPLSIGVQQAEEVAKVEPPTTGGSVASAAPDHLPSAWSSGLASKNQSLAKLASECGMVDDESYLALEATLAAPLRRDLGLARFKSLAGEEPQPDTILEQLWASPPWFMDLKLSHLGLTVRQSNVFRNHHLQTVADIARIGLAGLLKLPNLGQGSIHGLGKLLHAALLEGRGLPSPRVDVSSGGNAGELASADRNLPVKAAEPTGLGSLLECFEVASHLLRGAELHVWRRRLGFQSPQATLQELADAMGLSRERIRQIERQAFSKLEYHPCWAELGYRLSRALKGRTTPLFLNELPLGDPWFAEATSLTAALVGAVHHILPDRFDAFQIRGAWVVSHLTRNEWQDVCHLARSRLESSEERGIDEAEARTLCDSFLDGKGEELRSELWAEATANALWSALPGQPRKLVSLGRGAEAVVRAVLASSDQPLHFTEIHRRAAQLCSPAHEVRYVQNAAAAVGILFQRGTYGLARHCRLSTDELALVRAEAEDVVSGGEAGRQWHASELCDALLERGLGFDGRLTKYVVNFALQDCKSLVYLGRMVWGLGSEWQAGAASRLDVRQAVIDVLQHEGRPMTTAEVRERLSKVRGLNQTFQIVPGDPLARIGPGLWGLIYRDLDVHTAKPLVERLRAALLSRQTGLHASELPTVLGVPAGSGEERSVMALAQAQGIRIDRGEYAYLADWGSSRRVSVADAVSASVMAAGPSGIGFEDLCRRVNAATEREVPHELVEQALRDLEVDFDRFSQHWSSSISDADEVR